MARSPASTSLSPSRSPAMPRADAAVPSSTAADSTIARTCEPRTTCLVIVSSFLQPHERGNRPGSVRPALRLPRRRRTATPNIARNGRARLPDWASTSCGTPIFRAPSGLRRFLRPAACRCRGVPCHVCVTIDNRSSLLTASPAGIRHRITRFTNM